MTKNNGYNRFEPKQDLWMPVFYGFESMLPEWQLLVKKVYQINTDQAESDKDNKASQHSPKSFIKIFPHNYRVALMVANLAES
jgi:hypothetical protein